MVIGRLSHRLFYLYMYSLPNRVFLEKTFIKYKKIVLNLHVYLPIQLELSLSCFMYVGLLASLQCTLSSYPWPAIFRIHEGQTIFWVHYTLSVNNPNHAFSTCTCVEFRNRIGLINVILYCTMELCIISYCYYKWPHSINPLYVATAPEMMFMLFRSIDIDPSENNIE